MSFAAQYAGQCPACEEPIRPGQTVEYNGYSQVEHVVCPEPVDPDAPRRNEKRCTCNLTHAGECF